MDTLKTLIAAQTPHLMMVGQVIRHKMQNPFISDTVKLIIASIVSSTIVLMAGSYIAVQVLDSKLSDLDQRTTQNRTASETRDTEMNIRITHDEDIERGDIDKIRMEILNDLRNDLKGKR
jgi:hypothetical protein